MLNGVPGGDPLTFSIAVVAAASAGLLVYRDADKHGHYHALSASAAVGIAALVGFFVANLVGLAVATGYVLLLYLLSYPSTPGIDGKEERRTPDRPDGTPQGDAGESITGDDDVVSVIRVEIANEGTLRELAERYDDVPEDAPVEKLRSMLRVKALGTVLEDAETDGEFSLRDWAEAGEAADLDDWHEASPSGESERPSSGAAAWNAAPSGEQADDAAADRGSESESGTTEEWSAGTSAAGTSAEAETGSIEAWEVDAEATESGTPDESAPATDERANGDAAADEGAETGGIEGWTTETGQEDTVDVGGPGEDSDAESASDDGWSAADGDRSSATAENEPPAATGEGSSEDDEDDGFGWAEVEAE